ncbi:MAG TPA: hypothetical protein VLI04_13745, partial [Nocardioidaceae bacterium]|nr:hypothetical protein [Nocardioidaceae bacterium]
DGQPLASPMTTWSTVSGPGVVTFANSTLVDTTATFSVAGTYTLRLTANDGALSAFDDVIVTVERANAAPVVNAGVDQAIQLPAGTALDGTLVDPGYPVAVTTTWSKASGPGTVTFGNAAQLDTTATFSLPGTYTLRLAAANAALAGEDTMVVAVERANTAPVVNAGPNQTVRIPALASLDGTVNPGYPESATLTWTKVSGPGAVGFLTPSSADTQATFSLDGTYTLRLTADNGPLSSHDDVVVQVEKPFLVIDLGTDASKVLAADSVSLAGRVTREADGTPVAGELIEVLVTRAPGQSPQLLTTVTTGPDGEFALQDQPMVSSTYVAVSGADTSSPILVAVAPSLTSGLSLTSVALGQRSRLNGAVSPSAAGQPVLLQRWNGTTWVTVATKTLGAGAVVRYSFDIVSLTSARRTYRAVVPAYGGRVQTAGTALRLDVYRADIMRVAPRQEIVVVKNTGVMAINLSRWILRKSGSGVTRALPAFRVEPGRIVRIHSGSGVNDRNDLYLGRPAMWGTHGAAVLRNNHGYRLDRFIY